jgi:L-fucose isomerase-like protein
MTAPPRVGVVPLARATFDLNLAEETRRKAFASLERTGWKIVGPRGLMFDAEGALRAARALSATELDLLLLLQVTFTDAAMTVRLARAVKAPLVLWAFPEPRSGGRLRLNSLCGINLAAHALGLAGLSYRYLYEAPDDPAVGDRLVAFLRGEGWPSAPRAEIVEASAAGDAALDRLRGATVGVVGRHPDGFDTCRYDPELLGSLLGVRVEEIPQGELFARARALEPEAVAPARARAEAELSGLDTVDVAATEKSLRLYTALAALAHERQLAGLAVRCWPEPFTEYGCAACRPMGMLTEDGIPCACEADVHGDVTSLLLQAVAGEPAWLVDLVELDPESDTGVVWHCGLAPRGMADPDTPPRADIHSNRKLPLLAAFALKPGRVTLARLSRARNATSLVLAGGEVVKAPMSFSGTSGVVCFDRPMAAILEGIMGHGLEHHLSLAYGEHRPMLRAVAGRLGIPVVELDRAG